jgi:NADH-quinone oxidoreductase subunit C
MDAATLLSRFPATQDLAGKDMPTFRVAGADLLAAVRFLRDEQGFDLLADLCGAEWQDRPTRFGVVLHLLSTAGKEYVRLHVDAVNDRVPSVAALHPGANWHEREAYDMYGLRFAGHPDLRRILMWEGYPFFPLRKDFPLGGKPSEMPDVAFSDAAPLQGGPFVTQPGQATTKDREPRARGE